MNKASRMILARQLLYCAKMVLDAGKSKDKEKAILQKYKKQAQENFNKQYPNFQYVSVEYDQTKKKYLLKCKCKNNHAFFIPLPIRNNRVINCRKCQRQETYCYIRFIRERCNSPETTKTTSIDLSKYKVSDLNMRNQDHSDEFGSLGLSNTKISDIVDKSSKQKVIKNLAQKIKNADYDTKNKCFIGVSLSPEQKDLLYQFQNTIERTVNEHLTRHKLETRRKSKNEIIKSIEETTNIKAFYNRLYSFETKGFFANIDLYNKVKEFVLRQLKNLLPEDTEQ